MKLYIRATNNSIRTITSIDELITELEQGNYNYYGLRGAYPDDMNNLSRGYLDCSSVWEDGNCFDEKLDGTCALGVNDYMSTNRLVTIYNKAKTMYSPINTVLLIGDSQEAYGNDDGEVILGSNGCGADVIAIVNLD